MFLFVKLIFPVFYLDEIQDNLFLLCFSLAIRAYFFPEQEQILLLLIWISLKEASLACSETAFQAVSLQAKLAAFEKPLARLPCIHYL